MAPMRPADMSLVSYEQMAQAAKRRAAVERDRRLTPAEEWVAETVRDEWESQHDPRFIEGPPGGCRVCWSWYRHPLGGWEWGHSGYDADQVCRHSCHPRPVFVPVVAIA